LSVGNVSIDISNKEDKAMTAIQLDGRWIYVKGHLTPYWGKYSWRKKPPTIGVEPKAN